MELFTLGYGKNKGNLEVRVESVVANVKESLNNLSEDFKLEELESLGVKELLVITKYIF